MKKFFSKNKTPIIVLLSYFFINLLIFYPIFLGKINFNGHLLVSFFSLFGENIAHKSIGWDQIRQLYPYISFNLESIKNFTVPYWNPYIFSGTPHLANLQTGFFYPLGLLGFFLSPQIFWNLMRFSPYFLGAFFTYIYLRHLKLPVLASFLGGQAYGFSLLMFTWGEEVVYFPHGIIWLPLILFFIEKYSESKEKKFLGLLTLASSISIFAGFIQATVYSFIFIFFYLISRFGFKKLIKNHLGINYAMAFLLAIMICSIQLLPSLEIYFNSAREIYNPTTLSNFLNPPQALLSILAPDIFGNPATRNFFHPGTSSYYESIYFVGIPVLIFALIALLFEKKDRLMKFFIGAFFVTVALSVNFTFSKLQILLNIPFISSTIPNRVLFIPTFCLSVLCAFGAAQYAKKRSKNINKILFILFAAYIFLFLDFAIIYKFKLVGFTGEYQHAITSLRNMILPFVIFLCTSILLLFGQKIFEFRKIILQMLIIIALLNNIYLAHKFFSFTERKYVYPQKDIFTFLTKNQGVYRTLNMTGDRLLNNILMQYKIYSPEGYDPSNNKHYLEFISLMNGNKKGDYSRTVAELKFSKDPQDFISDNSQKKLVNLLGVKYFIVEKVKAPVFVENNFKVVFTEDGEKGFAIIENPNVSKRAFLTSNFENYQNDNAKIITNNYSRRALDITSKILSPDFDSQNKIIIEANAPVLTGNPSGGIANIVSYGPNEVLINTESGNPNLLFLSDNYYPGWKATIDGQPTEILRADYIFRAVSLPAGSHLVRFYFDSDLYKIGKAMSLLGLLAVLLVYFVNHRRLFNFSFSKKVLNKR